MHDVSQCKGIPLHPCTCFLPVREVGPSMQAKELADLVGLLNPEKEEGKLAGLPRKLKD